MARSFADLERDAVRLLTEQAAADMYIVPSRDIIDSLGVTQAEYVDVMRRLESRGLILDPAPSVAEYRHVVVTHRLLELPEPAPARKRAGRPAWTAWTLLAVTAGWLAVHFETPRVLLVAFGLR